MGGGSSKKASDRSLEVEQQIIQRQQAAKGSDGQVVPGNSPNKNRSKSVHVPQRVAEQPQMVQAPVMAQDQWGQSPSPQVTKGVPVQPQVITTSPQKPNPFTNSRVNNAAQQVQPSRASVGNGRQSHDHYIDPSLADLPPEYLVMLAQEGGILPQDSHRYQDDINEAIIASLMSQEQNAEEEQILREVMKISALEHQKQIGALNLDHLKKKNNKQQQQPSVKNNADLSDISNTFGLPSKLGELLPPISKKGGNVLPPPRLTKRKQQMQMEEDEDAMEERKFLEIINASAANNTNTNHVNQMSGSGIVNDDSLEMPSSIKKLPVKIKEDGTGFKKQSNKKGGGYDEEDDAFNDLLNSSPKKKPNQSTVKKDREWQLLERNNNDLLGGFDALVNDTDDHMNYGQSPAFVNKDLSRDLMKERKVNVINQGISLYPTQNMEQMKSDNYLPMIGGKGSSQRTGASTLDLHPTDVSKVMRSKMDVEDSYPTHDLYNDDDDDFDKLIGRIEKTTNAPSSQANINSKQTTQRAKAQHHFNDDEDFF